MSLLFAFFLFSSAHASIESKSPGEDALSADDVSNLNALLTEAREVPHFENGKPAGFRSVKAPANDAYQNLELKSGEVLTAPDLENHPRRIEQPRYK